MRLVVLGGNGRTGVHLVEQALKRGHNITALVRNPAKLPTRTGLRVCEGTPLKLEDIYKAFEAGSGYTRPEAVIVCLNPSRASDSPFSRPMAPPRFMADSVANAITAMKSHNVPKIVIMQALGVGNSFPNLPWWMRFVRHWTYMKYSYDDHDLVNDEVKLAGVDYVMPRPPWLTNGEAYPVRTFGNTGDGIGTFAMISRKSVANFLLDACERDDWDASTPVIASTCKGIYLKIFPKWAARGGQKAVVRILIKSGAEVNERGRDGKTGLNSTAAGENKEISQLWIASYSQQ